MPLFGNNNQLHPAKWKSAGGGGGGGEEKSNLARGAVDCFVVLFLRRGEI